jgi:glucose/arabinose dehydrogenase
MPTVARTALRTLVAIALTILVATSLFATPTAAAGRVSFSQVLSGYSRPVYVTAPEGSSSRRIFIVEQTGRIRVATYENGHWRKVSTFLDLTDRVLYNGLERGLLGLAFAPNYATSRHFYVYYTRKGDGDIVVAEFRRSARSQNKADKGSARQVLRIDHPGQANHNGGMLAFGPDGYLYIGTGDGGGGGDVPNNAQNKDRLLGKILRIDPRPHGGRAYGIPGSNPFVGRSGSDLVWAYGLRNPWRWSFDRGTGDLWIGDVGQETYEEVDHARASGGRNAAKGLNFGWHRCEGKHTYPGGGTCHFGTRPLLEYKHVGGNCTVVGGYVYRGPGDAAWHGTYIYGDYCSGKVWVRRRGGSLITSRDTSHNISSFGEDGAGRLFMTTLGGTIYQVGFSGSP